MYCVSLVPDLCGVVYHTPTHFLSGAESKNHTQLCVSGDIMADEAGISFSLADLGSFYKTNKAEIDPMANKCIQAFTKVKTNFYTDLKQWFNTASKVDSKAQSAKQLMKYIISFVLLAKEQGKSWTPPSVFGVIVPEMVLQFKESDGIEASDNDEDLDPNRGEDEEGPGLCPAISARELSTIMAKMEERITMKLSKSIQQRKGQHTSSMSRILAEEDLTEEEDDLPEGSTNHAAMKRRWMQSAQEDDVDVDDPDILYFPLQWLEKAQVSTAEMRQLMMTLKEATRIRNPKHKSEQYQVDHLLQVAHLLLKGKQEEAIGHIGYRIHFLLKSTTRQLGVAIDYYEHLVTAKRPQKEREADIMSKIPKGMPSKQASFLGQHLAGKGNKDKGGAGAGQQGAGAGQHGAGAGQHGAGDAQTYGGGRHKWGKGQG